MEKYLEIVFLSNALANMSQQVFFHYDPNAMPHNQAFDLRLAQHRAGLLNELYRIINENVTANYFVW